MKNKAILTTDIYTVFNKTVINDNDNKLITLLYQPIIGSEATALYNTLVLQLDQSLILSDTYTHYYLSALLQLSLNDVYHARVRLEGIGLIKTYYKENNINEYIYEIYSPMKSSDFFNNPTLSMALYNSIGKNEYKKIKSLFQLPTFNLDGFKNISSSFNDVFMSAPLTKYETLENNLKDEKTLDIKFNNSFDFEFLRNTISSDMINENTFNNEVKELILNLAFIYNIDILKIKELVELSLNSKKLVDKIKFRKFAREYYQIENYGQLPSVVFKNQPENLQTKLTENSPKAKIIYQFENITPYNFLKAKNKSVPPARELKILENLIVDIKLNPGVVNVLIDYVLKTSNNKLNKAFIEAIATEWKRSNINTVEEAMDHVSKHNKKFTKQTYSKAKTVKTPEWFNQSQSLEEITKDEQEQLDKLLEGYK